MQCSAAAIIFFVDVNLKFKLYYSNPDVRIIGRIELVLDLRRPWVVLIKVIVVVVVVFVVCG